MQPRLLDDISYAPSARSAPARALIRSLENVTGRLDLLRRANGYGDAMEQGTDFWRAMMDSYRLRLELVRGSFDDIPATGPLVMVANHPFGVLDGLVMGHVLAGTRRKFRILAHSAFAAAPEIRDHILPIDFSGTAAAQRRNIDTRTDAISFLQSGGAVGIFPGGTVATGRTPFAAAFDPQWRSFSARMIQRSNAAVMPLWFDGQNSRIWQLVSHMNYNLRMALLLREFRARMNRPVRIALGQAIPATTLSRFDGQPKEMMDFLRAATYGLADRPVDPMQLGYEFEGAYRN